VHKSPSQSGQDEPHQHPDGVPNGELARDDSLGLQHGAGAGGGTAAAGPKSFQPGGVPFFQGDAVVEGQLFARADAAQGFDENLVAMRAAMGVFFDHRFAVGFATVVDPARDIALDVGINNVVIIEGEQERMPVFLHASVGGIDFGVGAQLAEITHDAGAFGNGAGGEDAVTVDAGTA